MSNNNPGRTPDSDHPITIEPNPRRVVVMVASQVIADTTNSLTLHEAGYPPVHYIPRVDVLMSALQRSRTTTHCPYKGDAAYYSMPAGGDRSVDAAWSYETPFDAVVGIKDHLAFYPERVDTIDEQGNSGSK